MKKISLIFALCIGYLGISFDAHAHALWIQTSSKATKNKVHEVKLFYGEYASNEIDSTAKWYSDLKNMEVWVTSPSSKKTKLKINDATTFMSSSFIPEEEGTYIVSVVHTTKDLGGTTKYEFSSIAKVSCGESKEKNKLIPESPLAITAAQNNHSINKATSFQVWKNGNIFPHAEVIIMSPEGWQKTIKADAKGYATFTPQWKGRYVIETSDSGKETGEWYGKEFNRFWKGSTTSIVVE